MKNLQKRVDDWVKQFKLGYFKPHEILVRLMEEVGELAREVNHEFGPKKKKSSEKSAEMGDEIADVIFTLICLANSQNIDMDKHIDRMINKLNKRDKDRWERK